MSQEYSFSLPYDAFDLDLIGLGTEDVGSLEFTRKVSEFFAGQFSTFGGKARVVCDDSARTIEVKWTKDSGFRQPKDRVLELLQGGKIAEALPLLWALYQEQPDDTDIIYNLVVAYSELRQLPKAIALLDKLVELDPKHTHGWVAVGVAHIRSQQLQQGEDSLRKALEYEPRNHWAVRNLGACLLKQNKPNEAIPVLQTAVEIDPKDLQAIVGLGQALEEAGRPDDADEWYVKAIQIGGPQQLVDLAKDRRTAIAQKTMRERGEFRPDVMMYITGALDKFANMPANDVQSIGVEIALLGQSGLDINDPAKKYSLLSLPGQFSGLHLCSIMYAAFKQFAPHADVGIDFSKEYEAAISMRGQ